MRALPVILALLLSTTALPMGTSLPTSGAPASILVVTDGLDAAVPGLLAAGFEACGATVLGGPCFQPIVPEALSATSLHGHDVLFVGTHQAPGRVYDALVANAPAIESWVALGGSLVTLAEPGSGRFEFVPKQGRTGISMLPGVGNDADRTPYGVTHPALTGVDDADLDGWNPVYWRSIGERPSYLYPVVEETTQGRDLVLTGNHGAGCVVVANVLADQAAAAGPAAGNAEGAKSLLRSLVLWGVDCTLQMPYPFPMTAFVEISRNGATGAITMVHSRNVECQLSSSPTLHEARCTPYHPVAEPPPGARFVCIGTTVAAQLLNMASHRSEVSCGPTNLGGCTATAATPACGATTGAQVDEFPFVCRAKPGAPTAAIHTWRTTCGSADP